MNSKIEIALGFLKEGQPFTFGDLRFELEGEIWFVVIGWSQYLNYTSLTRASSLEELFQIKNIFLDMFENSHDLRTFVADKLIEYRLCFDGGGKASIDVCSEKKGIITWSVDLK